MWKLPNWNLQNSGRLLIISIPFKILVLIEILAHVYFSLLRNGIKLGQKNNQSNPLKVLWLTKCNIMHHMPAIGYAYALEL